MKGKKLLLICAVAVVAVIAIVSTVLLVDGECSHEWSDWTVTDAADCDTVGQKERHCTKCEESEVEAIAATGHKWKSATCTTAKMCSVCNAVEGNPLGHKWEEANCSSPKSCSSCSATEGGLGDHIWSEATCKEPKKCTICSLTEGGLGDHVWAEATCTEPKKCKECDLVEGEPLEHDWKDESDGIHRKCSKCGKIEEKEANDPQGGIPGGGAGGGGGSAPAPIPPCSHVEGTPANCTNKAICSLCNKPYGDIKHTWDKEDVACGEKRTCTLCYAEEAARPHEYKSVDTDPTCNEKGYTTYECENCEYSYVGNEVAAKGHTWNNEFECNSTECTVCHVVPTVTHSYVSSTTDADCTHAQVNTYKCSVCNHEYSETIGKALGHDISGQTPIDEKVINAEHCEYALVYKCKKCDEYVDGEIANKHTFVTSVKVAATCVADGEKEIVCSKCSDQDDISDKVIPKDSALHDWVEGTIENSKRTDTCSICSNTKSVMVVSGSKLEDVAASDLTDTEIALGNVNIALDSNVVGNLSGNVTLSADKVDNNAITDLGLSQDQLAQMGEVYDFALSDASGSVSTWKEGMVTITLPYELQDGEDVDSIAVWFINDNGDLESIKAVYKDGYVTFKTNHFSYYTVTRLTAKERCALYRHSWTSQTVEVTCTSDGYTLKACVRCHETEKTITDTALGHNYVETTTPATCTENGKKVSVCSNCEHEYSEIITAEGHKWNVIEETKATCDSTGLIKSDCENCDATNAKVLPQLNHEYSKEVVEATCETNGYTKYVCTLCEHSYNDDEKPALKHEYTPEWTWTEDNKASVVFNCDREGCEFEKEFGADAVEIKSETQNMCSGDITTHTAKILFNGKHHIDKKVVESDTVTHSYSEEWKTDEEYHWHECACGAKDGYEEHNFVKGICTVCGIEDISCDHIGLYYGYIDFSEYGACHTYLNYYTCLCGRYTSILSGEDPDIDGQCEFEPIENIPAYYDDEDNYHYLTAAKCKVCGLEVYFEAIVHGDVNACEFEATLKLECIINGEQIYKDEQTTVIYNHRYMRNELDLAPYGACEGSYLLIWECSECNIVIDELYSFGRTCGKVIVNERDENGGKYITKCDVCGLEDHLEYTVTMDGCVASQNGSYTLSINGVEKLHYDINSWSHDDSYTKKTHEMLGESCEEGYIVSRTCEICKSGSKYYYEDHDLSISEEIDLTEHGACADSGAYIDIYKCPCGERQDVSVRLCNGFETYGREQYDEELEAYVWIYTGDCSECGLHYERKSYTIDDVENCKRTSYDIYHITIGDKVWDFEEIDSWEDHDEEYTYELVEGATSCEDGVKVVTTCKNCDYHNEYTTKYHETKYELIDLKELGACGGTLELHSCACGAEQSVGGFNFVCGEGKSGYDADEDGQKFYCYIQYCSECEFRYEYRSYKVKDETGCGITNYYSYDISVGDTKICSFTDSWRTYYHDYEYSYEFLGESQSCEDGVIVSGKCNNCGDHFENEKWYGHITQTKIYSLDQLGACGGEIRYNFCPCGENQSVEVYNTACGEYEYDSEYDEDLGTWVYYRTYTCEDCGLNYERQNYTVIDLENCTGTTHYSYKLVINGEEIFDYEFDNSWESHTYVYSYEFLEEGSTSCEDGIKVIETCNNPNCDYYNEWEENEHNTRLVEIIDLAEHGACGGTIDYYSCGCGEIGYLSNFNSGCDCDYTTNKEYDENGNLVRTETRSCDTCGFRYDHKYYDVQPEGQCEVTRYNTYTVTVGDELLVTCKGESYLTSHTYEYSYEWLTESENCEDGVKIIEKCKYCDASGYWITHSHEPYFDEYIDLSEYGSVCGGSLIIERCACGSNAYGNLDVLCDFNEEHIDLETLQIDNAIIDEWQYTVNGDTDCYWNAYLYTCSVNEPEDRACGYRIRFAKYWEKVEGECRADRYQIWQLGYDPETDTCEKEIKIFTGDSQLWHNYGEETEIENGYRRDCPDCGSYYTSIDKYEIVEEGDTHQREIIAVNPNNDGNNKYYQYLWTREDDENGRRVYSSELHKFIGADGTVHINEYKYQYLYVLNNGKPADYIICEFRQDGDWWEKWEYTYNFEGVCERIAHHTNSEGVDETSTENACHYYERWQKEPTCSQTGIREIYCRVCGNVYDEFEEEPLDHAWVKLEDNYYFCVQCGLENSNGASGNIILEDLTENYGNGENYVVGYYIANKVEFTKYVSLIKDGEEIAIFNEEQIDFVELEEVCAIAFSKTQLAELVADKGLNLEDYEVRFVFVPYGSDSSFDYAVTFGETKYIGEITNDVAFVAYVPEGPGVGFTITPIEDGLWTFVSLNYDYDPCAYLYDEKGNQLAYNDDGNKDVNFKISYCLEAGQTYRLVVAGLDEDTGAGKVSLHFYWEPIAE